MIVLFDYEVAGKVRIENLAGKLEIEAPTDEKGQAQFVLKRGQSYKVKGSVPGFIADERKSKALKSTDTVLLKLIATSAMVNLIDLPQGAQIYIDDQLQPNAAIDKTGSATISELSPGKHKLVVKHPEYRDFQGDLPELKAGTIMVFPVLLDKVAKLTFQSQPNANVLIDGDFQGRIEADGNLSFDYELGQNPEHTIRVELTGYQPWSKRVTLKPGSLTIPVKLDPIVTSVGFSDLFDDLLLWSHPSTWKIVSDPKNSKLEVRGDGLGLLVDKIYRDFHVNFLLWLDNGKGATWVVRADKEGRNYYLFHLSGPKSTTYTPRRFYIFLVSDGRAPVRVYTPIPVIPELNNKGSYSIDITVRDHTITHTIGSNVSGATEDLGSWTDTSTEKDKFLYGTFGFCAIAGEVFSVDELTVILELPQAQPPKTKEDPPKTKEDPPKKG